MAARPKTRSQTGSLKRKEDLKFGGRVAWGDVNEDALHETDDESNADPHFPGLAMSQDRNRNLTRGGAVSESESENDSENDERSISSCFL